MVHAIEHEVAVSVNVQGWAMDPKLLTDKLFVFAAHPGSVFLGDVDFEFLVSGQKGLFPKAFGIEDDPVHVKNHGGYVS